MVLSVFEVIEGNYQGQLPGTVPALGEAPHLGRAGETPTPPVGGRSLRFRFFKRDFAHPTQFSLLLG